MKPSTSFNFKAVIPSLKASSEDLSLTGSQMNLAQRDKSPRKTVSECRGQRPRAWRRPASVDLSLDIPQLAVGPPRRRGSTHSLSEMTNRSTGKKTTDFSLRGNETVRRETSLSLCQRAGFCGSDALLYSSTTGHRCQRDRICRGVRDCLQVHQAERDVEVIDPDVMRYAYTTESARLLQTLLREPWVSDGSLESSPKSARSNPRPSSPQTARDLASGDSELITRTQNSARSLSSYLETKDDNLSFYNKKIESENEKGKEQSNAQNVDYEFQEKSHEYCSSDKSRRQLNNEKNEVCYSDASQERSARPINSYDSNLNRTDLIKKYNSEIISSPRTRLGCETCRDNYQQKIGNTSTRRSPENFDPALCNNSGPTKSTECMKDIENKEDLNEHLKENVLKTQKEIEVDLKFQRWFPNFETEGEKNVRFFEDSKSSPLLIDLTEETSSENPITTFETGVGLEPEKKNLNEEGTPRDSTLEDLVNILHVLENEETSNNGDILSKKNPPDKRTSPASMDFLSGAPDQPETPRVTQVAEIFKYLDQAERCSDVVKPVSNISRPNVLPALCESRVPRMEELLCRSSVDLAQEVVSLRLQAEEQAGGIRLLQQTVAELKEAGKTARAAHQAELSRVANEAEATLVRHQKMVKQLLAEKKNLNEKMSALMGEVKGAEERYQRNLKAMEERHLVEIQRIKETHSAAEKLKREKWIDVKTQKIKEMTVKGLEPELSRMAARQQQELAEQRSLHRAELEAVELRAARRTTELMDELRAELTRDKEEALQREIALQRTKWEKRMEDETRLYEEEARRLKDELRRERDRLGALENHVQEQLIEARRTAERDRERDRAALARDWQEKLDESQRLHQIELKNLKEALEMEKDVWMNNYKKIQASKFLEREADLHHQYKNERDRDIEIAIERLETEATKARLELTEAAESKLRRLREKLEGEIREIETECSSLKKKLTETRQLVADKDDQLNDLGSQLRHLQSEYGQLKKLCEDMTAERADIRKIMRAELEEQLKDAQTAVEKARLEMAELKTCHAVELSRRGQLEEQIRADAEKELQHVYNRVKVTIKKKDEALEALREQYKVVLERCSHLEQMLENQRRNLLLK